MRSSKALSHMCAAEIIMSSSNAQNEQSFSVASEGSGGFYESAVDFLSERKVIRPWGAFETIDYGERFQVKRITVNPGCALSLQYHHHRAEHWVVVRGIARVTRGEEVFILQENQSTFIPLGVIHRLENPGKISLEIIEVQSGSYLGEDDIVRLDDAYGRVANSSANSQEKESQEKEEI